MKSERFYLPLNLDLYKNYIINFAGGMVLKLNRFRMLKMWILLRALNNSNPALDLISLKIYLLVIIYNEFQ